ncbi:MAG TPA: winged helix-turn-helix transcriptional regulator [Opitutaceae bacterium]|jgi:DNA-binding HxlR family transcriptional regulator|nr:winged helix-turn-helix transcriptional regulator [Opitutaceae bacterium]
MSHSPTPRVGIAAITENMLKRKWSATILRYLEKGVTDPTEITKREVALSAGVISERLRTMHRYGLIARYPRPAPSTVIEYRLTPLGKKILEMINAIDQLDQQLNKSRRSIEEAFGIGSTASSDQSGEMESPAMGEFSGNNPSSASSAAF